MTDQEKMKEYIRSLLENTMKAGHFDQALTEAKDVNNFLDKEPATTTKQLNDTSKPQELGDSLQDIKMNQMADELGSDGTNAPTTAVKSGSEKGGNSFEAGQRQANFQAKTDQA